MLGGGVEVWKFVLSDTKERENKVIKKPSTQLYTRWFKYDRD
jgi:hypothetical protein